MVKDVILDAGNRLNKKYVLVLDLGTTGNRAILFDKEMNMVVKAYHEFKQYYPHEGWVEHDPVEIWETVKTVIKEACANIRPEQIASIGITNQRETTVIWDKSGKPIYNAIVWQCTRTRPYCEMLQKKGYEPLIRKKTGLRIDSYFSATKIKWILDKIKPKKDVFFGTIDTWILWNLTQGKSHATDYSNASRTMLFNIHTGEWDAELLKLFKVPKEILPEVKASSGLFGYTNILGKPIPITGIIGDQQAAMFAQGCYKPGIVKNTYGTGCFLLMNTGEKAVLSKNKLLTTIAWKIGNKIEYALEGSVFMGGASIQWLRDGIQIIGSAPETQTLAAPDNGGVYFVPALVGLGAPYWDMGARGMIIGITRGTTRGHLIRATLEAITYQSADLLKAMQEDTHLKLKALKVDGGACVNNILMQFQSDILNIRIDRPKIVETTGMGAAGMAGLAVGFWKNKEEIQQKRKIDRTFTPKMKQKQREQLLSNWKKAVSRAQKWI